MCQSGDCYFFIIAHRGKKERTNEICFHKRPVSDTLVWLCSDLPYSLKMEWVGRELRCLWDVHATWSDEKNGSQTNKNRRVPILYDKYLQKSNLAAAASGLFSFSDGILCGFPTFPQRERAIFVVLKSHEQEECVWSAKGLAPPGVWGYRGQSLGRNGR